MKIDAQTCGAYQFKVFQDNIELKMVTALDSDEGWIEVVVSQGNKAFIDKKDKSLVKVKIHTNFVVYKNDELVAESKWNKVE